MQWETRFWGRAITTLHIILLPWTTFPSYSHFKCFFMCFTSEPKVSLEKHYSTELSAVMDMFYICAVQYGSP